MTQTETIFALASGVGRAGIAVVRLSGPGAKDALEYLSDEIAPAPRRAVLRRLVDPESGAPLDDALVLYFPAPRSYSGEDIVELHLHGGPAVVGATLEALSRVPDLREAEPGEFTRRAYQNGKMDLTAAEGLADLIDAETEGQRRQALRQMRGELGAMYERWRANLLQALALFEAEIDFPDEDLPEAISARAAPLLMALDEEMSAHLADASRGERVRDGYRIVIVGPPNAGKSSLLNTLVEREAAIVSDIPGTTRDVIEARMIIAGFPVWIADTAGLRAARDVIEAEGVRRALSRAQDADLRLAVLDSSASELSVEAFSALGSGDLVVMAKSDLRRGPTAAAARAIATQRGFETLDLSSKTGAGIDQLRDAIAARVKQALDKEGAPALTRVRHRRLVDLALQSVRAAREAKPAELAAEDLRRAGDALGRITGRIDVEQVLDAIFADFCIGK